MIRFRAISGGGRPCKPRASGDDPFSLSTMDQLSAVNPARAGMIPARTQGRLVQRGKPRASGDDPAGISAVEVSGA